MYKRIFWLGILTLLGFPGIGFFLLYFFAPPENWVQFVFGGGYSIGFQIFIGAAVGILFGLLARWFIQLRWIKSSVYQYEKIFQSMNLDIPLIIFLSLAAGIGEELLFRVAIQHFLGVIITAFLFVAIHGYIHPKNWKLTIYGLGLTGFIILLGYARIYLGIFVAIAAHAFYDAILLFYYRKKSIQHAD